MTSLAIFVWTVRDVVGLVAWLIIGLVIAGAFLYYQLCALGHWLRVRWRAWRAKS